MKSLIVPLILKYCKSNNFNMVNDFSDLEERQRGELRARLVPDVQLSIGLPSISNVVQVSSEVRIRSRIRRIQGHLPTKAAQSR
jgi:hypothetical protein